MLNFSNVTKKYMNHTALNDIHLSLEKGKIIGIIGENGSGKSTILKLAAGLIQPTSGSVTLDSNEITRRSSEHIAYLSELDAYYSFYTVQETIDFYATQFKDFNRTKANEIMNFMGLDPKKKVKNLSKGTRGRLKMLLVLSRNVPVILMDEPLSGLDPMAREAIVRGLISFIDIENQIVVITTHELKDIETILDIVIVLKNGKILEIAEVENIREKENMDLVQWLKKIYKEDLV